MHGPKQVPFLTRQDASVIRRAAYKVIRFLHIDERSNKVEGTVGAGLYVSRAAL